MENEIISLLKKSKLKVTPSRLAILGVLHEEKMPLNAEDIFVKVKTNTDQVTVYRTLTTFEEKGIIRRVDLRKESLYYEINDNHHHHIVCVQCGKIEDFDTCDIEHVSDVIIKKSKHFKKATEHAFEIFGVCTKCSYN